MCRQILQFKVDNCGIDREKRQLSTILHMNQRPGRICTTKKAPHLRCFHCSAIQLPAANSLWKSSGFLSFMVCGSRRQYFVFAPHQVFAFSFCILLLFYLHRHLTWELPRSPNKKCISNEMHFLFSNVLSFQAASSQVLSALMGLTSMFGMDIGVSPSLLSLYIK